MNSFVGDVSVNSELDQVVVEPEMETFPVRISDVNNCKDCNKEVITNISMKYIFDLLTPEDFKEIKKMLNQSYETLTKVELFDLMKIDVEFFMGSLEINIDFKDEKFKRIIDSKQLRSDKVGEAIYNRLHQVRASKKIKQNLEHNRINLIWENDYDEEFDPYQKIIHDDTSNEVKIVDKAPKEYNDEFEPTRLR
tara:strand:+ start:2060 stop:2641 length:582 start_codon:yes stop_codon:yes gene_type:complete